MSSVLSMREVTGEGQKYCDGLSVIAMSPVAPKVEHLP